MTDDKTFVIVGGGLAGAKAAATLREEGFGGRVVLVAEEDRLPYERPPLSKSYLAGESPFTDAQVHDEAFYRDNDVELLRGTSATALDTVARTLSLSGGDELRVRPPADRHRRRAEAAADRRRRRPGRAHLRSVADADAIKAAVSGGGRLVVIGAGWIGCEVAASARGLGAEVTSSSRPDRRWRPSSARSSARSSPTCTASTASSCGWARRSSGSATAGVVVGGEATVAADAVLLATGVAPATALAEAAGLEVGNGILVDELLRTSAAAVFAAGDVASTLHPRYGRVRVEHWDNAIAQGEAAARSMLGKGEPYAKLPYFFTDQYDLGMEYVGRHEPRTSSRSAARSRSATSAPTGLSRRPRHGRDARQRLGRDRPDARARRGGRDALERLRVGAAHARAVAEVGAVHVQRDGDLVAGVVDPVDVVGWGDAADRAGRAFASPALDQAVAVGAVERLGLGALQDQERAPDQVVMDLGDLARPPHHRGDREAASVCRVCRCSRRRSGALVLGEQVDASGRSCSSTSATCSRRLGGSAVPAGAARGSASTSSARPGRVGEATGGGHARSG